MIPNQLPKPLRRLRITSEPVSVLLADEGASRLSIMLPPLEELKEIRDLSNKNYSLSEVAETKKSRYANEFLKELDKLLEKRGKFSNSATYFTRLANLAELAGEYQAEAQYLQEAALLSSHVSFQHRIGANLFAHGKVNEAEKLFQGLDIENDLHANLRLAYIAAERKRLDEAAQFVNHAIQIDPTDFGARLFEGALALVRGDLSWAILNFKIAAEEREISCVYSNLAIAYVMTHRIDKAFMALHKAIVLEPFSEHAIALLADLAFLEKRDIEAITSLENYLQFEQKSPSIWARLARALMETGNQVKALAALKRQASLEETSAVFNNLGVANARIGEKNKACEYFKYAIAKANELSPDFFLATRNLLSVYSEMGRFADVLKIAQQVVKVSKDEIIRNPVWSDIVAFLISSLIQEGNRNEASKIGKQIFDEENAAPNLKLWLATGLIADAALSSDKWADGFTLAKAALNLIPALNPKDRRIDAFKNNFAFLLLEMGQIKEAEALLSQLSRWMHVDIYPTATLGLLHLRKGHIEQGEALYHEAITLAKSPIERQRVAQKMHLELGRAFLLLDQQVARRHLLRAAKNGSPVREFADEAQKLLFTLKPTLK